MLMTSGGPKAATSSSTQGSTSDMLYNRDNQGGNTGGNPRTQPPNLQQNSTQGQPSMSTDANNHVHNQQHNGGPGGRPNASSHLLSTIPPASALHGQANSNKSNLENNMQFGNAGGAAETSSGASTNKVAAAVSSTNSAMARELEDARDKLKIMTNKFATTRKERDQLKTENKELQDEIIQLQSSMRQMVPCMSNTSQSFPMFNELTNACSELYKCDCQDVFFDLLCPELNLEGVVFFYQNVFSPIVEATQKHFAPADRVLLSVSCLQQLDGPVESVLRKTYQSNWRSIMKTSLTDNFLASLANQIQETLSICDGDEQATTQIKKFLAKMGELCFKMIISDPPICLDLGSIGQKVRFNQYKYESMDGFVKADQECFIILPSVHKQVMQSGGGQAGAHNAANQGASSFTAGSHSGSLGEVLIKANVLPLNYEFP